MPRLDKKSFSNLSTAHIDLQVIFFEAVKYIPLTIPFGYRSKEDQDKAFADGNSKFKWPDSKHNRSPSLAIDAYPLPIDWKNTKRFYWFSGFIIGIANRLKEEGKITHRVISGCDWDGDMEITDQTFNDLGHFELVL